MNAPICPNCGKEITRALDAPYGWWEWDGTRYRPANQASRVDMSPWVHYDCLGELRDFHPQDEVGTGSEMVIG